MCSCFCVCWAPQMILHLTSTVCHLGRLLEDYFLLRMATWRSESVYKGRTLVKEIWNELWICKHAIPSFYYSIYCSVIISKQWIVCFPSALDTQTSRWQCTRKKRLKVRLKSKSIHIVDFLTSPMCEMGLVVIFKYGFYVSLFRKEVKLAHI